MVSKIQVWVSVNNEDVEAGTLYHHFKEGVESATFYYTESYLARADAYALDPALPLEVGPLQTPEELPIFNAFSDSSPDRWGRSLVKRAETLRAKEEGETARTLSEADYLLGARDDLRQGNLRFRNTETGPFLATSDKGVPAVNDLPELLNLSSRIEDGSAGVEELRRMLQAGSSLGGMRPKSHIRAPDGSVAIAKFPSSRFDEWDVMAWEKVALDLARAAGVNVPDSQLVQVAGQNVLIVTRFDRTGDGSRVGYASALTMLEASDGQQRSYVEIAAALEELSSRATSDIHELWRRMAFSVLISNIDDHLRNHGFLHDVGPTWRLSPGFDMNPNPDPGRKYHKTAIDEADTESSVSTLLQVAPYFRLEPTDAVAILRDVYKSTREWRSVAEEHGVSTTEIARMEPAFQHERSEAASDLI